MFKLFDNLIKEEKAYFLAEEKKSRFFLNRGNLTRSQEFENDFWLYCCIAIQMELKEMEEDIKEMKKDYYAFTIRGQIVRNEDGSLWPKFYTILSFIVKGEENRGYQDKAVSLKFDKSVDWSKLSGGFLVVHKSKIVKPKIYEITTDEQGKKHYPFVLVREIEDFIPEPVFESPEMEENKNDK